MPIVLLAVDIVLILGSFVPLYVEHFLAYAVREEVQPWMMTRIEE